MTFEYCPLCGKKLGAKVCGDEGEVPFCESCNRPFFPFSFPCVICLCLSESGSEIALIRQSYGSHNFVNVAGYIKHGESAEDAAKREIKEEIGLEVSSVRFVRTFPYPQKDNLMLGFACKVKKADFTLSDEVETAEWFPLHIAVNKLRDGSIAQLLLKEYINERE